MKFRTGIAAATLAAVAFGGLALTPTANAVVDDGGVYAVRVTIENIAPDGGTIQTPLWGGIHDGGFDLYDRNAPISPELERLAEDGSTGPVTELFDATGNGVDATIVADGGGPIAPGASGSHVFIVEPGDDHYFSYASMVIPSNDAFVANGNPVAHPIIVDGEIVAEDFVVLGAEVLDAGSEVNDEVPENTAALAQAAPDTGVVEGGTVALHPGFIPGGNVLGAIPNGDFLAEGYETIRVSFDVQEVSAARRTFYSVLDGFQEVPSNSDSLSAGYANFKLTNDGRRLTLRSQFWNTENVVAAHLHLGARGTNGPVVVDLAALAVGDDLDDGLDGVGFFESALTGPLAGQPLAALTAEIEAGNVYINVHTTDTPSGELRGQLLPAPGF